MRFGYVRKLPSGKYQASYPGPDGKRYTAPTTFTHKADAQAWITIERRLIEYSTWTSPAARAVVVESTAPANAEREAAEALAAEHLALTPTVALPVRRGRRAEKRTSCLSPLSTTQSLPS